MGNKSRSHIGVWPPDTANRKLSTKKKLNREDSAAAAENEQLRRYLVRKRSAYLTNSNGGGGLRQTAPGEALTGAYITVPQPFCPLHSAANSQAMVYAHIGGFPPPLSPPAETENTPLTVHNRFGGFPPSALRSHKKLARAGGKLPRIPVVKRVQFPGNVHPQPGDQPPDRLQAEDDRLHDRLSEEDDRHETDYGSRMSFHRRFPMPRYIEHIYEQIDDSSDDNISDEDESDDERYNKILQPLTDSTPPGPKDDGTFSSDKESSDSCSRPEDSDDDGKSEEEEEDNDKDGSQRSESSLSDSVSKLALIRSLSKGRQRYLQTYSNTGWDWDDSPDFQRPRKPQVRVTSSLPTIRESSSGRHLSTSRAQKMASEPKYFRPTPSTKEGLRVLQRTLSREPPTNREGGTRISLMKDQHSNGPIDGDSHLERQQRRIADRLTDADQLKMNAECARLKSSRLAATTVAPKIPDSGGDCEGSQNNHRRQEESSNSVPNSSSRFILLSACVRRKLLYFVDFSRFSRRNPC